MPEFVCRCCGHRGVGPPAREPPGFVMRCADCGTEYAALDDPGGDVQGAIDRSHRNRRLADSIR
jgi:hypothetical protein